MEQLKTFFAVSTLPLYLIGLLTFFVTLLNDWLNPKKIFKPFVWYLQEFLYTVISISLGIGLCLALKTSPGICWVIAIIMGLIGSTLIRKIFANKDKLTDDVVNDLENKVSDSIIKK